MRRASENFLGPLLLIFIGSGLFVLGGCGTSESSKKEENAREINCIEPENPYTEGTGHYAGYEWAEKGSGTCNGSSTSFNEGCEEYETQESEYQDCESRKKH